MPLIYVNAPEGTFSPEDRDALAEKLTTIGLDSEKLPQHPFDRSTCWIYFRDYPHGSIYHGGKPGGTKVISLEVNSFAGLPTTEGKLYLYQHFTDVIQKHANAPQGARVPVYIILREVETRDWGVFGHTLTIDDVRKPHPELAPI
ncbi:tautomerase family protein [Neorhizobium sp. NPDC001467]|uniref:tautomerase family protein n=1 Tax=Neorhizobium sp. NPDC001467 TaxID=3390595 RepID=UPI003D034376